MANIVYIQQRLDISTGNNKQNKSDREEPASHIH